MQYLEWNERLLNHFFRPEMADRSVYLYVNKELIESLGVDPNPTADFVRAVKEGPPWANEEQLCGRAMQALEGWRDRTTAPAYVAYLALFVLAAGIEGDFAPHAYYPRLRSLLGEEPTPGHFPSFDRMLYLWDDLERWSVHDRSGQLGIFTLRLTGGWINVGVPLAQTMLTERERGFLPNIFAAANLDPHAPPSPEELREHLVRFGTGSLTSRTVRRLARPKPSESEFHFALLEVVSEELEAWDGQTVGGVEDGATYTTLRVCATVDRITRRVRCTVRCKLEDRDDDSAITLTRDESNQPYVLALSINGWSTPLTVGDSTEPVDAATLDWINGVAFTSDLDGLTVRLPASRSRILVSGAAEGLQGLVEVNQLPAAGRFYLLTLVSEQDRIENWGRAVCQSFSRIRVTDGVPVGWGLFEGEHPSPTDAVDSPLPKLSVSSRPRLRLLGGIRAGSANHYFRFALPRLVVTSLREGVRVFLDDVELRADNSGSYRVHPNALGGTPLRLLLKDGDNVLSRRTILIVDHPPPTRGSETAWMDNHANILERADRDFPAYSGVLVRNGTSGKYHIERTVPITGKGHVAYIGRRVGEIIDGADRAGADWDPVWVMQIRRRGIIHYCGVEPEREEPVRDDRLEQAEISRWKQVIWTNRRRVRSPTHRVLARLWGTYLDAARDA